MADHAHDHDGHGGLAHVASIKILAGVFGALLVLTVVTVLVAKVDFGGRTINLAVAMFIAAIKASLVILFFMHLKYDKLFHSVVVIVALMAAALFVGFTLVDRSQYAHEVEWDETAPPELKRPTPPRTAVDIP